MHLMPCTPSLFYFYLSISCFTLLHFMPIYLSSPFFAAFNVRLMSFSLFSPDPCVPLQISEHAEWDGEPGFSWWRRRRRRSSRQVGQKSRTSYSCSASEVSLGSRNAGYERHITLGNFILAHSCIPDMLFERLPLNCMWCLSFKLHMV